MCHEGRPFGSVFFFLPHRPEKQGNVTVRAKLFFCDSAFYALLNNVTKIVVIVISGFN